jgi:threonine synthase
MKYRSTRGSGRAAASKEAILRGIAEDGGLFVPERIPSADMPLNDMTGLTYSELALYIMKMYLTDFTESELKGCIDKAYGGRKFEHEGIVPVSRQGDIFFLELYHGPTLAFKDIALSILPHLLMAAIKELEGEKQAVILAATSGDTGVSALEGFAGIDGVRTIVFYPVKGVSDIQRRQMVAHAGKNSFVAGLEGNFDDAQGGVKSIFNDEEYRRLLADNGYMLSSANSINIGRLIPQIVYYFHGYLSMLRDGYIKPGEQVNIAVPTGNFGNILAAYYARRMGLPVSKLICASNENAVLCEYFRTGIYNRYRVFKTTCSPSMDILVSSNLERLNYYLSGENPLLISELMRKLSCFGRYEITREMRYGLDDFYGGYASDEETIESIGRVYAEAGYVMDTHTAVAYSVYKKYQSDSGDRSRTMIAATASPFKFAGSVCSGIGAGGGSCDEFELVEALSKKTGLKIPDAIEGLKYREVVHRTICSKENMKQEISRFLKV